jgi:3-oxoacyl-[acyl-carrier protein] reductase
MTRSVLVTGGNRGLGLAIARTLRDAGDAVTVSYRSNPPEDLPAIRCDVTDAEQVDAMFTEVEERQGAVEVLVANAGTTRDTLMARMTEDDFVGVLDANLVGTFRVARRAVRSMMRARAGRIIMISSVNALSGSVGQTNYAASKAGLIGLARSLARELGPIGVTVNVVAPGYARTDMTSAMKPAELEAVTRRVPIGRLADPDEIAWAVRFLADEAGAYITGAVIPVDGGLGMGH